MKDIRTLKTKREERIIRQVLRTLECDCGAKECKDPANVARAMREWFGIDGAQVPSALNAFGLLR